MTAYVTPLLEQHIYTDSASQHSFLLVSRCWPLERGRHGQRGQSVPRISTKSDMCRNSLAVFPLKSPVRRAVCQAGLLDETFASTATETTQSGASNCAEGLCLLCEGRFSPRELYRMFFWSRQGKQQQLCTSSWGGMYLCVCAVQECVCVHSGCGADGEGCVGLSFG